MRLAALLLAASSILAGADRDFDRLVRAVESRLGVKQTHIPFLGVANFFVKVARPDGVSSFHLAIFENLNSSADERGDELDRIMAESATGLRPLVRSKSHRSHERTYVYAAEFGKTTKLLIANFERNEATIIEADVSMDALLRALQDPSSMAHKLTTR